MPRPRPSRTPSAVRPPHRCNGERQLDCCIDGRTEVHTVEVQETVDQEDSVRLLPPHAATPALWYGLKHCHSCFLLRQEGPAFVRPGPAVTGQYLVYHRETTPPALAVPMTASNDCRRGNPLAGHRRFHLTKMWQHLGAE